MTHEITVQRLFDEFEQSLALSWLHTVPDKKQHFHHSPEDLPSLVGYVNFFHPPQVGIIGSRERDFLQSLSISDYQQTLDRLFATPPQLIVLADAIDVHTAIVRRCQQHQIPLLQSQQPAHTVIDHFNYFLSQHLAANICCHGVFMEVFDIGTLITGDSGVGKSELALELIDRGHRLVADDAPIFAKVAPTLLDGSCPNLLQDLLEVRGLGILNIRAMYGNTAIKDRKNLHLIINVVHAENASAKALERLHGINAHRTILAVDIPEVTIPVAPGRNLAILVEGAVRNHVLKSRGYNASIEFSSRQQRHILQQ